VRRTHVISRRFGHKAWRRSLEGKPNSCLLETLFARVWRCRSSFDTPKALRFRANPFINWGAPNGPLKRRILAQREVRAEALLQVDNLIPMVSNYERSVMGGIRGTGVLSAGSQASTNCANPLFLIRIATPAGAAGRWIATAAERFIAGLDSPT